MTRNKIYLHRLVHSRMTGRPLSEYTHADVVRHKDPHRFLCRRSNLFRKTGHVANKCDLNVPLNSNSTSGIHGVSWNKQNKKWLVQMRYLYKNINLGRYATIEQAARVATATRVTRSKVTCSDVPMDFPTMKKLLQAEAKRTQ